MIGSREAVVDYMTPLGLHHQMARGHHYGPGPWVSGGSRADWTSVYYNRADSVGIGFDRSASGSNAVAPVLAGSREDLRQPRQRCRRNTCCGSTTCRGITAWLPVARCGTSWSCTTRAASRPSASMRKTWASVAPYVDAERHAEVAAFLGDSGEGGSNGGETRASLTSRRFSKRPLPQGYAAPAKTLQEYEAHAARRTHPGTRPPIHRSANEDRCSHSLPLCVADSREAQSASPTSRRSSSPRSRISGGCSICSKIPSLRPGANPRDPSSPNAPNYDEAKARSTRRCRIRWC